LNQLVELNIHQLPALQDQVQPPLPVEQVAAHKQEQVLAQQLPVAL
jgi:hypothetical protein